jgi:hypothetical protein
LTLNVAQYLALGTVNLAAADLATSPASPKAPGRNRYKKSSKKMFGRRLR